jgi:primase-polymerase (primpol)-like protein
LQQTVRNILESGEALTSLAALRGVGTFRLAARVHELRREGVPIETRLVDIGKGRRIALYSLPGRDALLSPKPETIPATLKALPQWLLWKAEPRTLADGTEKVSKVPASAHDPRKPGSTTDPATWGTFDQVWTRYENGDASGVGFVFTRTAGIVGIDLDDAITENGLHPKARQIVRLLNSYAEVSVSGRGLHVFVRGRLPWPGRRKGPIEVYGEARFFTVTGATFGGLSDIAENQKALDVLVRCVWAEERPKENRRNPNPQARLELSDSELVRKASEARNGAKFKALWSGDWSGYPSQSEADAALLALLMYWTNGDESRCDALFRQSGLYRPKWDRADYRERTFAVARKGVR